PIAETAICGREDRGRKDVIVAEIVSFRDLDVWNVAMDLVVTTYGVVERLPASEQFALSAQMRRAVVSIPSNIAEGHSGGTDGRFLHHVRIARGSLAELETQLEAALRLHFVSAEEAKAM